MFVKYERIVNIMTNKGNNSSKEKGNSGLAIGIALGCSFGILFHNLALGICIGVAMGVAMHGYTS